MAGGSIRVDLAQPAGIESVTNGAALKGDASVQPAAVGAAAAAVTSEISAGTTATMTTTATMKATATMATAATAVSMEEAVGEGQEHATAAHPGYDYNSGKSGDGDDADDDSQQEEKDEEKEARLRQAAVVLSSPAVIRRVAEKLEGYRLPSGRVEELRETLNGFVGTKNYHNYTNHKKHEDPSCKRCVP